MAVEPRKPTATWRYTWTRWDGRQLGRAAGAAALMLALSWVVTAATDEGGVSWGARAGRALPLTPLCSAVGAWVTLAPLVSRGEILALETLGRSRAQIAAAAVLGAALVAFVSAIGLGLVRAVDVTGFYPTATHGSAWAWTGVAFADPARGIRVGADGAPVRIAVETGRALLQLPAYGRAAASAVTASAGLALPLLVAHTLLERVRALPQVLAAAGTVVTSVVIFQAAAAGHVPAAAGALPALALLVFALRRYGGQHA